MKPEPAKILETLADTVVVGQLHLQAWKELRLRFSSRADVFGLAPVFFPLTAIAHMSAAYMACAKLLDDQSDATTPRYYFNVLEARRQPHGNVSLQDMMRMIQEDRAALQALYDKTTPVLKPYRDRFLVHMDRRFLEQALSLNARPEMDEIEACLSQTASVLRKYCPLILDGEDPFALPELGDFVSLELVFRVLDAELDRSEILGVAEIDHVREFRKAMRAALHSASAER